MSPGPATAELRQRQTHPVQESWKPGPRDELPRLISAEALRELNGFDEEYFAYVEDAELSLRMIAAGYRILYQPLARVLHHAPPPGTPPTSFQIRQRDRNRRRVMRTHFPLGKRLPFLGRFYLTRTILLLRYLLSGDGDRTRAILAGMGKI